jgi:transposase-like protein
MPKSKPPYPDEYRLKVIELARSGRTHQSLTREFGVTGTTIRNWLRQADLDEGRRKDGVTSDEKQELARLRKENERLREEQEILKKAAAWFAQEAVGTRKKRSDS